MDPKGSKMEPKGIKMEAKAIKMEPKGAKREPKGDQSASRSRLGRQGRFWELEKGCAGLTFGFFLEHFLSKKL